MALTYITLPGSSQNLLGGVPNPFATPTFKLVQEAGGGTTTATDASGNVTTLPTFVVQEPKFTGGELGNIFNPNQITGADYIGFNTELSGATPGISPGTGIGAIGGGPTSTVKVGDTKQTVSFDDIVNKEIQAEIERMRNEGVFSSDPEFGTRIEVAANRGLEIYNAAAGPGRTMDLGSASGSSAQTGPGRGGPPIILPIAGLDPTTAAAITALGLIFSGGKIARLDLNNPAGSVVGAVQGVGQTGQNVVDVATGKTSIGEILDPGSTGTPSGGGTSTTGTTGSGGQQTTGTGAVGVVGGIFGGGTTPSNTQSTQQNPPASTVVLPGSQITDVSKIQTAVSKPAANQQVPKTGGPGAIVGTGSSVGSGPKGGDIGEIDNVAPVVSPGLNDLPTPQEQPAEVKPVDPFKPTGDTDTTTCPSPNTPILLADGTEILAGDLKPGMLVRTSHEHTKVWGNYPVTEVRIVKDKRLCLVFDQGRIICSPTHKFSTGDGWKEAAKYRIGEVLQHKTVRVIEYLDDGDVVAITVDDAHTYVSNGLLSHNKTPIVVTPPTSTARTDITTEQEVVKKTTPVTPVIPTGSTTPTSTSTAATPIVINAPTVGYTLPQTGTPAARNLYTEAGTTLASLAAPMRQFQIGVDAQGKPIYGTATGAGGQPLSLSEAIAQGYGGLSQGMTGQDIQNLLNSIRAQTGTTVTPGQAGGYQSALTQAANEQTAAANTALRSGNIADAEALFSRAQSLRQQANPQLYGDTGTLGQYATAAQNQVARDIAALRQAETGQLTPEQIRNAQQSAREAYAARGQVFSQGAAAQEVLNRQAAIQQREQLARQNLAQSMGQLGQGVAYQTANIFDPMAATLGAQYGMQSQNVGLNQALYNQAMGLTSGAGGYGFAQQMINPFSGYAQDVYGTNVNALNAAQIAAANRQAALEAAKMGQTGTYAQALGGLIASGGLGQIQSGISGGIQGLLNLLGGQWPTGSSSMITPTVARPGT